MHLTPNEDKVLYGQFELLEEITNALADSIDKKSHNHYLITKAQGCCKCIRTIIYDDLPAFVNSSANVNGQSVDILKEDTEHVPIMTMQEIIDSESPIACANLVFSVNQDEMESYIEKITELDELEIKFSTDIGFIKDRAIEKFIKGIKVIRQIFAAHEETINRIKEEKLIYKQLHELETSNLKLETKEK